jgi:RNA polymerase sigma-70 factor (ECF subfamily)
LSFPEVYKEHAAFVWRSVRRLGVRDADVADVCQEIFLVAYRKLETFDGTASVRTWLFGIALRVCADHRKRAHVRREQPTEALPDFPIEPSQADDLDRRKARAVLDHLLDGLEECQRAVFVLYELERMPMSEVAQALGCPVQTGYTRLHAARERMQAAIRRWRQRSEPT